MAKFQTRKFIEAQREKGRSDVEISEFLQKKGFDPSKPSQEFKTGIGGFATGVAKGVGSSVVDLASLLQKGGQAVLSTLPGAGTFEDVRKKTGFKSLDTETESGKRLEEKLTPRGSAEKLGATAETVAEFALPVGLASRTAKGIKTLGQVGNVAKGIAKSPVKVGRGLTEAVSGEDVAKAIETGYTNPQLQRKVIKGEITSKTIGDKIANVFKSQQTKGIQKLQKVRETLTGTTKGSVIAKKINPIMQQANKGSLQKNEKIVLNDLTRLLREVVSIDKPIKKSDIDKLIKEIDRGGYFRKGANSENFQMSNKVVGEVRKALREITTEKAPEFEKALKIASEDIDFFKKLDKNLVKEGNLNVDALQSKINTLAKQLDDPDKGTESLQLLKELLSRAGKEGRTILDELEVFSRTAPLRKTTPLKEGVIRGVVERGEKGVAGIARKLGDIKQKFPMR